MLVMLDDDIGDRSVGVDGVAIEMDDLRAGCAEFVEETDLAFDRGEVAKGLSDLDIIVFPAAGMDSAEPAWDVCVKDEMGYLFKGDMRCGLLEDLKDALVDRCYWYSHLCMHVCAYIVCVR